MMRNEPLNDEQVMGLVELVLAQPSGEREAYLRRVCPDDPLLFEQVWEYVHWEERMHGFLLEPLCTPFSDEPQFEGGELLLDRFRVVRTVGQGGMGIVYEAMDEKLDRAVAIKCAKAGFRRQLPPEVRNAREVTHPNVCKIFEIHTAPTPKGPLDFVVMEFLEGETLADRLSRGPVAPAEAQEIAVQLCEGLAEAHRKQVVHGDLKTANVILSRPAAGGIRAVITDFGLARSVDVAQMHSGPIVGTPDYMSPELLRGGKATVSSDVYALGVILYELASGRRPFEPVRPLITPSVAAPSTVTAVGPKRLNPEAIVAERLKRRPPALKHRWNRAVQRCLDPDPSRRFATAVHLAEAVAPPNVRRIAAGAAVAAALAVAVWGGSNMSQPPRQSVRLAVLPFLADEAAARFGQAIAVDTADRLSKVKSGKVRFTVMQPGDAAWNKVTQPDMARRALGATHVLQGDVRTQNGRVLVHGSVIDTQLSVRLKEFQMEYAFGELKNASLALAGLVTGSLHLSPLMVAATVNSSAYPDWAQGVALLRGDVKYIDQAVRLLESAVAKDPESPSTHARLAEALVVKYREMPDKQTMARAWAAVQEAQRRNPELPDVLMVSAMVNQYAGQYDRAEAYLLRALEIDANNGDLRRRLGMVYKAAGRFSEALAEFRRAVDAQPGYFKNYQEICALEIEQANDYDRTIQECRQMVAAVPDMSDAHFSLGTAYSQFGYLQDAERELRVAISVQETPKALLNLAWALLQQSRYSEAIQSYERAIQLGLGRQPYLVYLNLGTTYRLANLSNEAEKAYRTAMAYAADELARNPRDALVESYLAYLHARLNDRANAELEAARAERVAPDSVNVRWMLALTYEALGDHERTLAVIQQGPGQLLKRLNRFPDCSQLQQNPKFQQLLRQYP